MFANLPNSRPGSSIRHTNYGERGGTVLSINCEGNNGGRILVPHTVYRKLLVNTLRQAPPIVYFYIKGIFILGISYVIHSVMYPQKADRKRPASFPHYVVE